MRILTSTNHGYDIHMYHEGHNMAGMLNLLEAAGLAGLGHYTKSPETFFWFTQVLRGVMVSAVPAAQGGGGIQPEDWMKKETAARIRRKDEVVI